MHHARRPSCGRGGAKLRHLCPCVSYSEGREMYGVELNAAVRLAVVDEGLSHHEVGLRFGIDRQTVKKMLSYSFPIRLTPMTATCRVPPLSRVKLGIGWSRGVARDAEQ